MVLKNNEKDAKASEAREKETSIDDEEMANRWESVFFFTGENVRQNLPPPTQKKPVDPTQRSIHSQPRITASMQWEVGWPSIWKQRSLCSWNHWSCNTTWRLFSKAAKEKEKKNRDLEPKAKVLRCRQHGEGWHISGGGGVVMHHWVVTHQWGEWHILGGGLTLVFTWLMGGIHWGGGGRKLNHRSRQA